MQTTTSTPLDSLRNMVAQRLASIDEVFAPQLPYLDAASDNTHVLLRQHSMLTDLKEAAAIGVTELDFAFEGEFDPVEHSLVPEGETAFEKHKALHEIALAGIEPIIAAARAAGIAIHAPELELEAETPVEAPEQSEEHVEGLQRG